MNWFCKWLHKDCMPKIDFKIEPKWNGRFGNYLIKDPLTKGQWTIHMGEKIVSYRPYDKSMYMEEIEI